MKYCVLSEETKHITDNKLEAFEQYADIREKGKPVSLFVCGEKAVPDDSIMFGPWRLIAFFKKTKKQKKEVS